MAASGQANLYGQHELNSGPVEAEAAALATSWQQSLQYLDGWPIKQVLFLLR